MRKKVFVDPANRTHYILQKKDKTVVVKCTVYGMIVVAEKSCHDNWGSYGCRQSQKKYNKDFRKWQTGP